MGMGCDGKITHSTLASAEIAVARMETKKPGEAFNAYKCAECGS
jgi:hypothetical protein